MYVYIYIERERERASERERERERKFWLEYCTFAWGPVPLPCIGGELGGLTWTVPPGEPTQFSQRCLSRISDAVLFKAPWVASAEFGTLLANRRPSDCKISTLTALRRGETDLFTKDTSGSTPSFAKTTSTLGGGERRPEDRDLGRDDKTVTIGHGSWGGRNKKICRICRAGGGVCRQGLRKTHERADPACRFHGSDARGNTAVARGDVARGADQAAPRGEGSSEAARPRQHVPFEQMTRFVTKGGIGLHYLPGPLDQWACRDVVEREGEWHDNQAGRPLNEAEKGEYTQYMGCVLNSRVGGVT